MLNLNIITSIFKFSQKSLTLIDGSTLLLKLPVTAHHCPCCNCLTSKVHSYRNQSIKSIGFSLVYRKRRYICSSCSKAFFEDNFFLSRYQRMTKDTITKIIQDHSYLIFSSDNTGICS